MNDTGRPDDSVRADREIERHPSGEDVLTAFEHAVDEGAERCDRTWRALIATGVVGGLDVGVGVLVLLIVREATGSVLLGALAFPVGFVALTLGNSELFTENFFVPVTAVIARRVKARQLVRLWVVTLVTNLVAGWIVAALMVTALPNLTGTASESAHDYLDTGIGTTSAASALLAGMVITLMTWLLHSTSSMPAKLIAAYAMAFVLVAGPLEHSIVGSIEIFAALVGGTDFGYADWLGFVSWAALGNLVGGICLVTTLRLIQIGPREIASERAVTERTENE